MNELRVCWQNRNPRAAKRWLSGTVVARAVQEMSRGAERHLAIVQPDEGCGNRGRFDLCLLQLGDKWLEFADIKHLPIEDAAATSRDLP